MDPLTDDDFRAAAAIIGGPWTRLKALNRVESNGKPDAKLFEPHIFYRELKKRNEADDLEEAVAAGVAHPKWKGVPYRSANFDKAVKINRECAYLATSWGQFQIMGFNYSVCGYPTVEAFVKAMTSSTEAQLKAVCGFIMANKTMHDAYVQADWHTFARLYNGTLYYKNDYHNKLARFAAEYRAKEMVLVEEDASAPAAQKITEDVVKTGGGVSILAYIHQELNSALVQLKAFSSEITVAKHMIGAFGVILFLLMLWQIYKRVRG